MPLTNFICEADGGQPKARPRWPGELCPMSAPVVTGILKGMRPEGFGLSVTSALGCPRKRRLMATEPYALKPSEAWWAYRGQLMHGISAEYAQGDAQAIAEQRFTLPGDELTGQPDLVLVDQLKLVDYKTTKAVPGPWRVYTCPTTDKVIRAGAYAWRNKWIPCPACKWCQAHKCAAPPAAEVCAAYEPEQDERPCDFTDGQHVAAEIETLAAPRPYARHIQQVSLYRLLLWENGLEVDDAEIVYQSMAEQLRLPVTLLTLEATRALLAARVALHTQPELPGILTDPEDLWECDYCAVRGACEELYGAPVGK